MSDYRCMRLLLLPLWAALGAAWADSSPFIVLSASTPLLLEPSGHARQAGEARAGHRLEVRQVTGEWAEVPPPHEMQFWVHSDFLEQDRIMARRIQLRAGPGIHHSAVGSLEKGRPVSPMGQQEEWVRIRPPSDAVYWVAMEDLARSAALPRIPGTLSPPFSLGVLPSIARDCPGAIQRLGGDSQPPTAAPDHLDLLALPHQGEACLAVGELRRTPFLAAAPTRYRLIAFENGVPDWVCHVWGNAEELHGLLGHRVAILGHQYWVSSSDRPVLVANRVHAVDLDDAVRHFP